MKRKQRWLNLSPRSSISTRSSSRVWRWQATLRTSGKRLEERLLSWLGTAWPDPYVGAFLGAGRQDEFRVARKLVEKTRASVRELAGTTGIRVYSFVCDWRTTTAGAGLAGGHWRYVSYHRHIEMSRSAWRPGLYRVALWGSRGILRKWRGYCACRMGGCCAGHACCFDRATRTDG